MKEEIGLPDRFMPEQVKPQEKECAYPSCSNTFLAKRSWQRFCSIECKNSFWEWCRFIGLGVVDGKFTLVETHPNAD